MTTWKLIQNFLFLNLTYVISSTIPVNSSAVWCVLEVLLEPAGHGASGCLGVEHETLQQFAVTCHTISALAALYPHRRKHLVKSCPGTAACFKKCYGHVWGQGWGLSPVGWKSKSPMRSDNFDPSSWSSRCTSFANKAVYWTNNLKSQHKTCSLSCYHPLLAHT